MALVGKRSLSLMVVALIGVGLAAAMTLLEVEKPKQGVAIPDGYRLGEYRAQTPAEVPGATTVTTKALAEMLKTQAVTLIDVIPQPPKDKEPRKDLPGSLWLPGYGKGNIDEASVQIFTEVLKQAVDEKGPESALVFYCKTDCWHSWNASKRALSLGFNNVFWYSEGTDGWRDAGFELVLASPVRPDATLIAKKA